MKPSAFFAVSSLLASLSLLVAGCAAQAGDGDADLAAGAGDDGETGESAEALSSSCTLSRAQILASAGSAGRRTAIERGFGWYDARVPYSQTRSHDGYRTDCSGFVSMCWSLGTSYTTASFSSGTASSFLGSYGDLEPADALVYRKGSHGHIVLFLGWNDAAHSSACVLEQASTASDMQLRARSASSLRGSGFRAIRSDAF